MKQLKDILFNTSIVDVTGNTYVHIHELSADSRQVREGCLFVAIKGSSSDGHQYIDTAISLGAKAIVYEDKPGVLVENVTYIQVKNSAIALGQMAANFYGNPSEKIKLVGVTGTNGKTTTATLLFKLFRKLGYNVGLLSTVRNQINDQVIPATHTTPDAIQLNALLSTMVEEGCSHCFMEVSSHAIDQHRIAGCEYTGAIFTNITHDHLDYHKTFEAYLKAKKMFFDQLPSSAFALVNNDDRNGMVMLQNTKAHKHTYSLRSASNFKCRIIENSFAGLMLQIDGYDLSCRMIGQFNAYNLLAVYATAILLGEDKMEVLTHLSNLDAVDGRFDYVVAPNKVIGIVDYAHTPDALQNVLKTIQDIRTGNEKVITIVGCGGNRDAGKRPIMAQIACEMSDKVILTSDNPRNENPQDIIHQMEVGVPAQHFKKTISITDRKEAIKTACSLAQPGDIILLAGKGHENYQEIQGVKHPFDDKAILTEFFQLLY